MTNTSLRKTSENLIIIAILWFFGGGQIFLFFSRIRGFWFDNFYGIVTGVIVSLAIIITIFGSRLYGGTGNALALLCLLVACILLSVLFSNKINNGDFYAFKKMLIFLPFVLGSGIWGIIINKNQIHSNKLFIGSLILVFIGNILIVNHYASLGLIYFRVGAESNAIALSYAFANIWALCLFFLIERKKYVAFAFFSTVGLINVFLLSTRQAFVYFIIVILLSISTNRDSLFLVKDNIKGALLSRKKILLWMFLMLLLLPIFSYFIVGHPNDLHVVGSTWNTARTRWENFLESNFSNEPRKILLERAFMAWKEKPFIGQYAFENPGENAHNTVVDALSQYGLFGTSAYLLLIICAFIGFYKKYKYSVMSRIFFPMFIAIILMGITVTSLLENSTFHFLLFYGIALYFQNQSTMYGLKPRRSLK